MISIREATREDLSALRAIGVDSAMFLGDELAFFLAVAGEAIDASEEGGPTLRVAIGTEPSTVEGAALFQSEAMAQRVANLLFIGALVASRGKGVGQALLENFEAWAKGGDHRLAIIETASDDQFAPAWSLYERNGYEREARIRDYYAPGIDKIVYRKALT